MTPQHWIMYLTLVLVATATPGPAVLYITTHSSLYGWRTAIFAALGNILGLFCLGVIAVTGLGAILNTSEIIFTCIRYAGAAYLIYLGCKMLFQKQANFSDLTDRVIVKNISAAKVFLQAFGVALSNPKAIVFLTALFPQFINAHRALVPQFSILIATLMLFSFSFLMLYALLAHTAKTWLQNPGRIKAVNRTSGSIFIGFGILLAASSSK
jgi:threonine/homoserine/homoserine lactone efflux protein